MCDACARRVSRRFKGAYGTVFTPVCAHAELTGVWRLFGVTYATVARGGVIYGQGVDPEALFAETAGALTSMTGTG